MKLLQIDGKPIVDAKKDVVLHILPQDVKAGRKKRPDCCAAAQACMRQMGAKQAKVHLTRVYVERPKEWLRFETPHNLRTEIISFDRGHRFEAGDFKLAAPRPSSARRNPITNDDARRKGTHPQRARRVKPHVVQGVRYSASPAAY